MTFFQKERYCSVRKHCFLLLFCLCFSSLSIAQVDIQVNVLSGSATTDCVDGGGAPDPRWSVNVDNQGWVVYPEAGFCFTDPPNVQYNESFSCFATTPDSLEICLSAFEDDGFFCIVNPTCVENICQKFPVPTVGTTVNHTLALPNGGSSEGSVNFDLSAAGVVLGANDLICNAIELGELNFGTTLGDASLSNYNNYCATNLNEPNPNMEGFWGNNLGVWFHFTTGTNLGTVNYLNSVSDPQGLGDVIDLQLALYRAVDGNCTGSLDLMQATYTGPTQDEAFYAYCLEENASYYILIDGANAGPGLIDGFFGLEVINEPAVASGEMICDAEDMGMVPDLGTVSPVGLQSNVCANAVFDPNPSSFISQHSVWFSFLAPTSKHVIIEATTDLAGTDPVDIQMALYETNTNLCTGTKIEVASVNTPVAYNELLEVECLVPGQRYWILMDGAGTVDVKGTFNISVSDGGPLTPQSTTMVNETLCFGDSLVIGGFAFQTTGSINVTLDADNGCDSLVMGSLTILEELTGTVNQTILSTGNQVADGAAMVSAMGGDGSYTYLWSDNQTTATAVNLLGGEDYCVTVTDGNGCSVEDCLTIFYPNNILSTIVNDTLDCFGDTNGVISFDATNGLAPYNYTWNGLTNGLGGMGVIATEGAQVSISDLPAGVYEITIADAFVDSVFYAEVLGATALEINLNAQSNVSCFGACDGSLAVNVMGGTGPYNYEWEGSMLNASVLNNLCAGTYALTLTDAKNCEAYFQVIIDQPDELLIDVNQTQAVSCFGGDNGQAIVSSLASGLSYSWDNGESTAQANQLTGGIHMVTVSDLAGCTVTGNVSIDSPNQPLSALINLVEEISCFDGADGMVQIAPSGSSNYTYLWSNGATTADLENLSAGDYFVTVTDGAGCTTLDNISLTAPTEIQADFTLQGTNCFDGENSGSIEIVSITGGLAPYDFNLDNGVSYSMDSLYTNLEAGAHQVLIRDAGACVKSFDLNLTAPDPVIVTSIEDTKIKLGESIYLATSTNTVDGIYSWNAANGLNCTACLSPIANPTENSVYSITVLDSITGCVGMAEVYIEVSTEKNVFIPNAFSPNFDGTNDYFTVYSDGAVAQVNYLRVFDRWGALVYEATGFNPSEERQGWDGTHRGKAMNTGVYLYIAEVQFIDGTTIKYGGDVSIIEN